MRRLAALTAGAALVAGLLAGCGSAGGGTGLTVFAAASLSDALPGLDARPTYNFAGSDELAAQLEAGARADVYLAASPRYPKELEAAGIVEGLRVFATNRLVLVVPAGNPAGISGVDDLLAGGSRVVIGAEGVPVGDYTRALLDALGAGALVRQVASEEPDVKGVVAKVASGAADAGFVYATDAAAARGRVEAIELPAAAQPPIEYVAAVVTGSDEKGAARAFVERLLGDEGRAALRDAGFGLP